MIFETVLSFICIIGQTNSVEVGNQTATCDAGWTQHNDTCYMVDICKSTTFGGQLVEIYTPELKAFLEGYLRKTYESAFGGELFWLGGTDQYTDGQWVWSGSNSSFTFQDWWNNATPLNNTVLNCLTVGKITLNKFKDEICDNKHFFVCEKRISKAITTTTPVTPIHSGGQHTNAQKTTQLPDIDVNHELPAFIG
ncbi:unnamed protein product [Mytilus coruscus]|uniref:C-type lectin domain-containing protein n=1 Tax=Mytilus coruscus TaxID=42192 RepID=A0A6J8CQH5_MYTCO|nr:unnamed protein product [Mytilus coruscus]